LTSQSSSKTSSHESRVGQVASIPHRRSEFRPPKPRARSRSSCYGTPKVEETRRCAIGPTFGLLSKWENANRESGVGQVASTPHRRSEFRPPKPRARSRSLCYGTTKVEETRRCASGPTFHQPEQQRNCELRVGCPAGTVKIAQEKLDPPTKTSRS